MANDHAQDRYDPPKVGSEYEEEQFSEINPGVVTGGGTIIGESSFLGMGAIIRDHITIGDNSVIGAGSLVLKNVVENTKVFGLPARVVKWIL